MAAPRRSPLVLVALALALAAVPLGGCGGSEDPVPPARTGTAPEPAPALDAAERRSLEERRRQEAPTYGFAEEAGRAPLLRAARATVLREARRRAAAGELHGRFREVSCELQHEDRAAARDPDAPILRYQCLAISFRSASSVIGRPFLVRLDLPDRRFAACLFLPVGGEGTHAASTFAVQPSPACAAAPAAGPIPAPG